MCMYCLYCYSVYPNCILQRNLELGNYTHPKEFKHDVNLVWNNCMTYNADGSEYYNLAANLKKIFEERYAKVIKEDGMYMKKYTCFFLDGK